MKVKADFLEKDEIEKLHEATLYVLSRVGVSMQNDKVLEILRHHGAKVDGNKVLIRENLLREALAAVPKSFPVQGRETKNDVIIGGDAPVFASASGPVYVRRGQHKYLAKDEDFINFIKLSESSKVLNVTNYIMVEPQDVDPERRKMHQVACCLKYSTKPLIGITMGDGATKRCLKLVENFFGSLAEHRLIGIISPISPLVYDEQMLDHVIQYAEAGQPLLFASCSLPGATSPITLSGTMVIDNAEVLAGIVLSQLIRPGLPVIFGNTSTACDMRYASPAIGSPETALITLTTAALSKFYGIPCRSGGNLTDAKTADMQAGLESMLTILPSLISGVDFVLQSCGILESFNTISYEKFVIDEETLAIAKRFVAGYEIREELMGLSMIEKSGPGANFLGEQHTIDFFRKEQYVSGLFSKEGYAQWEEKGALPIEQRAGQSIEKRLREYTEPGITKDQEKILGEYL
ncbi:MAG: trimethylamine methyltransferase family protein [Dehalobacterium sp.]